MRPTLFSELGRRPRLLAALAALAAVLLFAGARLVRSVAGEDVAVTEVRAGRFQREVTATGTFKAVRATPIVAPVESGRSQKIAVLTRDGTVLKAGDLVVEFDPWSAEKEAADGLADVAAAEAKIAKTKAEGGKTARSLGLDRDLAKEQLDRAETFQLTDTELFSRNAVIESALDRALFAKRADVAGRKLDTSGRLAAADRALGEIEAGKARVKVAMAQKSLRALRILAPHDGLLLLERKWTGETAFVGDSVWPGQKIAEIPDLSELEARVFVLETDAAGLKPGLAARLSIEGRPDATYAAKVSRADPLAKSREWGSPVKYFETTLALEKTDPAVMKPGQRVRAVIQLEEAEGVIAIPRGALFERDGKRVVYRREAGGFVPVEVTVGRNSVSRVVVEKGLRDGDRIALRDPSAKAAPAGPGRPVAGPAPAEGPK
jgi:multidrug efflux pump subunit AcrA (membrane-fusion protein)